MQTTTIARPRADRTGRSAGPAGATIPRGWTFLAALAVSLTLWAGLFKIVAAAF